MTLVDVIKEVTYFKQQDHFGGLLVLHDVEHLSPQGTKLVYTAETWLAPLSHEELMNLNMSKGPQRLVGLQVGSFFFVSSALPCCALCCFVLGCWVAGLLG